jgi:hypothetical protein
MAESICRLVQCFIDQTRDKTEAKRSIYNGCCQSEFRSEKLRGSCFERKDALVDKESIVAESQGCCLRKRSCHGFDNTAFEMLAQILANLLKVPLDQACDKVYFVDDLTYTRHFLCIGLNSHES